MRHTAGRRTSWRIMPSSRMRRKASPNFPSVVDRLTLLVNLVAVSRRVGATSSRLAKVRELAAFLHVLSPEEVATGVLYLSGETPQGRSGLGYSTLRAAAAQSAAAGTSTLSIAHTDQILTRIALIHGAGSAARRA